MSLICCRAKRKVWTVPTFLEAGQDSQAQARPYHTSPMQINYVISHSRGIFFYQAVSLAIKVINTSFPYSRLLSAAFHPCLQ